MTSIRRLTTERDMYRNLALKQRHTIQELRRELQSARTMLKRAREQRDQAKLENKQPPPWFTELHAEWLNQYTTDELVYLARELDG